MEVVVVIFSSSFSLLIENGGSRGSVPITTAYAIVLDLTYEYELSHNNTTRCGSSYEVPFLCSGAVHDP